MIDCLRADAHAPTVPEVYELRVHGVGGTPAEGLLGVQGGAALVRVGGDEAAPFVARKDDRTTEGYVWGKLTSKGLLQPFWLLLLPFTLVNVAGWSHRPDVDLRRGPFPLTLIRLLIHLVGLTLTGTYVVWLAHVLFNRLMGLDRALFAEAYDSKLWLGFAALCLAIGVVFLIARKVQRGFEGFSGPGDVAAPPPPGLFKTISAAVRRSDDLSSARFWMRGSQARILLWLHVGVAGGAALLCLAWGLVRADPRRPGAGTTPGGVNLETGQLIEWATAALLTGLILIAIVHVLGWRVSAEGRKMFRLTGPMTPAATGVGLGTGFLYGVNVIVLPGGPGAAAPMGIAFGIAAAAWLVGGGVLAVALGVRRRAELRSATTPGHPAHVEKNDAPPAAELTGATPTMYGRIATARAMSNAAQWGGRVLTGVQIVFVVAATLELLAANGMLGDLDLATPGWRRVASLGHYVALSATAGVLYFLVRRAFKPNQRRLVGMIWDVLTFWPRRFHPLGVRPYAERAVPELQHRLARHADEGHMVILSAHSQGTVLAYAALAQRAHVDDDVAARISLLTYGSPLWQLHAQAFPAYFDRDRFAALRDRLFGAQRARPTPEPAAWRSFYRRTDYIGKEVFGDPRSEQEIPDPAAEPRVDALPPGGSLPSWPDPPRTVWADLAKHSFYFHEVAYKEWIAKLRGWMASGPRDGGSPEHPDVIARPDPERASAEGRPSTLG